MERLPFTSCAGASNEPLWDDTQNPQRCFLVEQCADSGTGSPHTFFFFAASFEEALAVSDVTNDAGWENRAIYLVCRQEAEPHRRLRIASAFNVLPHGFLCRLENGLEILAPYDERPGVPMRGTAPVQVYGGSCLANERCA
jgi:hypothetical protein